MAPRKKSTAPPAPRVEDDIRPRREPVQARSRARFERILDGFRDLVVEKGADGVSMKEVAAAAGISIASLYQYFPDKAAIIATLAHRYNEEGERCVEEIFAPVDSADDLGDALGAVLEAYHDFFLNVAGSHAIWQASLADVRLHPLDEAHCEATAAIMARSLARALPHLGRRGALREARLFTILIAAVVRKAIALPSAEARALLRAYRQTHLASALRALVRQPE